MSLCTGLQPPFSDSKRLLENHAVSMETFPLEPTLQQTPYSITPNKNIH